MLTAKYSKVAVYFAGDTLEEQLLASESLQANRVESYVHEYYTYENGREQRKTKTVSELNWHSLITRGNDLFSNHPIHQTLSQWGLTLSNVERVESLLERKRNKFRLEDSGLGEFRETPNKHMKTWLQPTAISFRTEVGCSNIN